MLAENFEFDALLDGMLDSGELPIQSALASIFEVATATRMDDDNAMHSREAAAQMDESQPGHQSERDYESSVTSVHSDAFDDILSTDSRSTSPSPCGWVPILANEAEVPPMSSSGLIPDDTYVNLKLATDRPRAGITKSKRGRGGGNTLKTQPGKLSRPCTCAPRASF